MDTTIKSASYSSIPPQSQNEDKTASSENSGGIFRTLNNNRKVVIGLGVVLIGGTALGLWAGLTGVKCEYKGNRNLPECNTTNTNGNSNSTDPGSSQGFHAHNSRSITFSNAIHPSTQQFIADSITTPPKVEVTTTHASWLPSSTIESTSTASQGVPAHTIGTS
ncbi:hypothetical protein [Endozoicomonas sp. SESOKO1]|uniref:hypothetical protein n=1 Tax=Endozoicomonas sp. SESOKO1 TaxID=2828742 RepID=UPI00214974E5|nr:hypothetical protein [Endozoicomonas sp. SESOKO1]